MWVGTKSMILKNSQIGHDVVIGADTLVSGEVRDNLIYTNKREEHISSSEYEAWSR